MSGEERIGYADAMRELQTILAELESEDVDVDVLSVKVRRAVELIRLCRERITSAEMEVSQIVAELDDGDGQQPT